MGLSLQAFVGTSHGGETSELAVESENGRHVFTVELALSAVQRMAGLQGRRELASDAGMLFDFKRTQPVVFWMKDTYLPLDMIFIAADGRIVNIAHDTVPMSEKRVPSDGPVRAVLEINAGLSKGLGIRKGDRVIHPIFGAQGK